jgi:hypothetical protein
MEPYQYIISHHPHHDDPNRTAKVLHQGVLMADSQKTAFLKMLDVVTADEALEADLIEFRAKPFVDDFSCPTKKDMGSTISYRFYSSDNVYEFRNTTVSLEDLMKGSFMNYLNNEEIEPELPMTMSMIDVLGLKNDDKL